MYKAVFHLFTLERSDICVHIDYETMHVLLYADKCTRERVPGDPLVLDVSTGFVK